MEQMLPWQRGHAKLHMLQRNAPLNLTGLSPPGSGWQHRDPPHAFMDMEGCHVGKQWPWS